MDWEDREFYELYDEEIKKWIIKSDEYILNAWLNFWNNNWGIKYTINFWSTTISDNNTINYCINWTNKNINLIFNRDFTKVVWLSIFDYFPNAESWNTFKNRVNYDTQQNSKTTIVSLIKRYTNSTFTS